MTRLLQTTLDQLREVCWGRYDSKIPVLVHGDTHHSNFVRFEDRLILCDPDNICWGSKEKDLANIWTCRRHYIDPVHWDGFQAGYSLDYDQELLEALVRAHEVGSCFWLTQFWTSKPKVQPAIDHILKTINQPTAHWVDF